MIRSLVQCAYRLTMPNANFRQPTKERKSALSRLAPLNECLRFVLLQVLQMCQLAETPCVDTGMRGTGKPALPSTSTIMRLVSKYTCQ